MPPPSSRSQKNVLLVARLSRTGDVKAASGDIEAAPLQVAIDGKEQITLILNRPVP